MKNIREIYIAKQNATLPNRWDLLAFAIIFAIIVLLTWQAMQMAVPFRIGESIKITLDPNKLPMYALRTVVRMGIAMICSFIFTFVFGTWAAKNRHAEKIIIPAIDILQSVPVLGFLSIAVIGFIELFPNSLLGPECAAIFVIFTSQAWNMALSFYQSLKTLPDELIEAATVFHLSAWQRFWRIEVPFAMPGLLWNTMLSMSAGWFFIVFSEAISVSHQQITLPGIGSYIALAIEHKSLTAIFYAIVTMLIVIFLYDQLLFRPLLKWSERFKMETTPDEVNSGSWFVDLLLRTRLFRLLGDRISHVADSLINTPLFNFRIKQKQVSYEQRLNPIKEWLWNSLIIIITVGAIIILFKFVLTEVQLQEILQVFGLGLITALRVFILIFICSLLWIPIGIWIGMRPWATQVAQPIAQFLAAFPANLLYPLVVILILKYHLNINVWTSPLMILGTQWYILFNVIAGTSALPKDLHQATTNLGLSGWLKWRRFILPGIFPYFVTGVITAAGGAWNASIAAEIVSWGHTTLVATGLGAYINHYTTIGDFPRIALGIGVMCLYVIVFNRLIWHPLYRIAEQRYRIS